jgi:hypothetical protein
MLPQHKLLPHFTPHTLPQIRPASSSSNGSKTAHTAAAAAATRLHLHHGSVHSALPALQQ